MSWLINMCISGKQIQWSRGASGNLIEIIPQKDDINLEIN